MSLKIKSKQAVAIPPMEAGTYPCVCIGIVDLGEQHNTMWNKYEDRVLLLMEFPDETVDVDGEQKPRWLSREFSASMHDKANLAQFIAQWRGVALTEEEKKEGFDLRKMLGEPGLASVSLEDGKDGKQYNRLNGMMGIPKRMLPPVAVSELLWFDMDQWDDEMLRKLPGWVQDRVKKSTQYQKEHAPAQTIQAADQPMLTGNGSAVIPF